MSNGNGLMASKNFVAALKATAFVVGIVAGFGVFLAAVFSFPLVAVGVAFAFVWWLAFECFGGGK